MLSPHRKVIRLVAGVLVACAANLAFAQQYPDDQQVFPPGNVSDLQFFAPPDTSFYDGYWTPNRGFFASFDGLYWSVGKPDVTSIGIPAADISGALGDGPDTSSLTSNFKEGNRFEFGYMGRHNGLMGTYYQINTDLEYFTISGPLYGIVNASGGAEQRLYNTLEGTNTIKQNNVELLYVRRLEQFHRGGLLDIYLGVRYLQFDEQFEFTVYDNNIPHREDVWVNTLVDNHLIGPEIGGRYSNTRGRWTLSLDGRFMPGFNFQNFTQAGEVDITGANGTSQGFTHSQSESEFAPLVELRAEIHFQLTRAIQVKAGWNGIWMDNIARASSVINYASRSMGFDMRDNRQDVLLTGVTVGIEVNR